MGSQSGTNQKTLSNTVKVLSEQLKPFAEFIGSIGVLVGPLWVIWVFFRYSPVTLDIVPTIIAIAVALAGFVLFLILSFRLELRWLRVVETLLKQESVVASVFVFDGSKVLMVEDNANNTPWLVPPNARIRCFTAHKGGPEEAVIQQVKTESGIGIEIDRPTGGTQAVTPIARPLFAQSERQFSSLGKKTYHDFYYLGHLIDDQHPITNPNGSYKWIDLKDLGHSRSTKIPDDMKTLIQLAFKQWQKRVLP
jgi:hypothetical protein